MTDEDEPGAGSRGAVEVVNDRNAAGAVRALVRLARDEADGSRPVWTAARNPGQPGAGLPSLLAYPIGRPAKLKWSRLQLFQAS